MVLHRLLVNSRGCMLLYMKLIGVVVFQRSMLYWRRVVHQSAMGICALCYICNLFGVMVFQRCMFDWRRRVGAICHGYMCIVLYMKLMWCTGFPEIYAQLEEGWGQSATGICALYYI